jgi:exosortase H (IPTLxxWG-CTERM-specific)
MSVLARKRPARSFTKAENNCHRPETSKSLLGIHIFDKLHVKWIPRSSRRMTDLRLSQHNAGKTSVRFAIRFLLICTILFSAVFVAPATLQNALNDHTAKTLASTLQTLGFEAKARESVVAGNFSVRIIPECTLLFPGLLFTAFVTAYPAPGSFRIAGLFPGLLLLYALNHLRLVAVYLTGELERGLFEITHVYLGQVFMVLAVFMVCLAWTEVASGSIRIRPLLRFLLRFAAFSIPLFWLWLQINHLYVAAIEGLLTDLFSFFGHRILFQPRHSTYFETFNLVTIAAVVASMERFRLQAKGRAMAIGLISAFVLHVIFRILNVLLFAFGFLPLFPLSVLITALGQYLLPLIIVLKPVPTKRKINRTIS